MFWIIIRLENRSVFTREYRPNSSPNFHFLIAKNLLVSLSISSKELRHSKFFRFFQKELTFHFLSFNINFHIYETGMMYSDTRWKKTIPDFYTMEESLKRLLIK